MTENYLDAQNSSGRRTTTDKELFISLGELVRPFAYAWLLNEARVTSLQPGGWNNLRWEMTSAMEHVRIIFLELQERRWMGLVGLRAAIRQHLGPDARLEKMLFTVDSASRAVTVDGNGDGVTLGSHQLVVPSDLLKTPYAALYELSTYCNADDDRLGNLLRTLLRFPTSTNIMSRLMGKEQTGLFGNTHPRPLNGPSFNKHGEFIHSPYWATDLSLALLTLRFLDHPTRPISPSSVLAQVLSNDALVTSQTRMFVWALGTELQVPDMHQLLPTFNDTDSSTIAECARQENWFIAQREALRRIQVQAIKVACNDLFYSGSPIRLGADRNLIIDLFRVRRP
ncbi:hypothetical protein IWQ60_010120 [Tieghemiomyces parasiticus]|uniref:Uncharacterized protein n=1 Tax=Tieghemiomyces parasiticus TaxID=78921 RepID=A0A9W7ZKR2_9FUNG|nr:hypothetical protein IWQ60_010120 [Tieghemiomyces parasiticus]